MSYLPHVLTADSLTVFVNGVGKPINISHPNYSLIRDALLGGNYDVVPSLLDVAETIREVTSTILTGRVMVIDGEVIYITDDGRQETLRNSAAQALLAIIREAGSKHIRPNVMPMIRYLENVMANPSEVAREELWSFIEKTRLALTEDGCFLAFKKVRADYLDIYSGSVDNHVGQRPEYPREKVDPCRHRTCSTGLHFCSESYLSQYGYGGVAEFRVMIVKVNPADVVAIPADYNDSKGRTWTYEVVGERLDLASNVTENVFTKPVYTTDDIHEQFHDKSVYLTKDEAVIRLGLQGTARPMDALRKRLNRGVTAKRVYVNGEEMVQILEPAAVVGSHNDDDFDADDAADNGDYD